MRPSSILGVEGGWLAYQLDLACLRVGRWVEQATAPVKHGGEGKRLEEALREPGEPERPVDAKARERELRQRFRPGLMKVTKKMQIPESGVW